MRDFRCFYDSKWVIGWLWLGIRIRWRGMNGLGFKKKRLPRNSLCLGRFVRAFYVPFADIFGEFNLESESARGRFSCLLYLIFLVTTLRVWRAIILWVFWDPWKWIIRNDSHFEEFETVRWVLLHKHQSALLCRVQPPWRPAQNTFSFLSIPPFAATIFQLF